MSGSGRADGQYHSAQRELACGVLPARERRVSAGNNYRSAAPPIKGGAVEREGFEPSVRLPVHMILKACELRPLLWCPNSQVLGFACAPAVFPKAVLARA